MLKFGTTTADNTIKNSSETTFTTDVIEASHKIPIVVDFWAPWCGPCKTFTPALVAAVKASAGKVQMVKIDIDKNPHIAQQLRIQSIPAVFAFVDGQVVDGFIGVKSTSELKKFINKIAALKNNNTLDDSLKQAQMAFDQGDLAGAAQSFAMIFTRHPDCAAAYAGLISVHLAAGQLAQASAMLKQTPQNLLNDPAIISIKARVELIEMAQNNATVAELQLRLENNENDHQARFDLATTTFSNGDVEQAIKVLLELFRRDRNWNDQAAKKQLFKVFESLGANNPHSITGRRKLASMIFS